jgi:hypothetical protein
MHEPVYDPTVSRVTRAWGVEYDFLNGDTFTNDFYLDFDDAEQAVIDHMIVMAVDEDNLSTMGEFWHTIGAIGLLQQIEDPGFVQIEDLGVRYTIFPGEIHHLRKHTGGTE